MEKIVDFLGQEIKVGDIVVATNSSTVWQHIFVVTRLGSSDKIQLNGSSYAKAAYLMVCNEQYQIAKGEEETKALREKYSEFINQSPVEKKPHTPRFIIYRCSNFTRNDGKGNIVNDENPEFWIIATCGTVQDTVKKLNGIITANTCSKGDYFQRSTYNEKTKKFLYADISANNMSRKALVAFNADAVCFVDQKVDPESSLYTQLKSIPVR